MKNQATNRRRYQRVQYLHRTAHIYLATRYNHVHMAGWASGELSCGKCDTIARVIHERLGSQKYGTTKHMTRYAAYGAVLRSVLQRPLTNT
jgi:hypothetical protein